MTTPQELSQKICNTAVKLGISPTSLLAEEIPIITSSWPWLLIPPWCPTIMKGWIVENCIGGDVATYYAFPDENTFAMFLFKFPGVIPSNLWFEPFESSE
jgi:hypothetical protein